MDNFFINMFRKREVVQGIPPTTDPNADWAKQADTANSGTFTENIAYVSDQERALRIATYYRCMELRANTMAQLTPMYQVLNAQGGNFVENNRRPWRHLNYIMQVQPNPLMSSFEMWRQVEIETVARGNAFILIQRDVFGMPDTLWLASCGQYDPLTDHYMLTWNGIGGQQSDWFPSSDVIHVANTFRRQGGYMGIPTLDYARDMLTLSKTLDQQSLETAAKGGRMKLVISEEKPQGGAGTLAYGMFNKKETDAYAREVQDKWRNNDVIALRGLEKMQGFSMSAADMQLFDQRQFGVAEICRVMATPRTLAMDGSNSSYKTPEADRLDFLMNCIQPKRRLLEDELNRKLLTEEDFTRARIHLCELPLMMFDSKGRAEIAKLRLESGTATVNELRKEWDMPAVEKGDISYVSTNLAELGSDKLSQSGAGRPATSPTTETTVGDGSAVADNNNQNPDNQ